MELPHLGKHCSHPVCHKLDFLPINCDACNETFCDEHFSYTSHNCHNAYQKNNQVPVCPLCNIPIPVQRGLQPDVVVGAHIDTDCQSDPAKSRRKVFTNKCSMKKCKNKEVIPVVCNECKLNYCLKHRHPTDHSCEGPAAVRKQRIENLRHTSITSQFHGNISEDEALAKALALSMQDSGGGVLSDKQRQEELDLALARQLQASEGQATTTAAANSGAAANRDKCNVS